jgi:hypothetical protein
MPDDAVTTSWKRSTDKVRTPGGVSVHRSLAETSRTLHEEAHSHLLGPSSHTPAEPAGAGCPTERNGEAIRQAATLAAWEDEGGTTVFLE